MSANRTPDSFEEVHALIPLQAATKLAGLDPGRAAGLWAAFAPHAEALTELLERASTIESDPEAARAMRLEIRRARIDTERTKKAEKAASLCFGKAVDTIWGAFLRVVEPEEDRLDAVEHAAEIAAKKAFDALVARRTEALAPYADYVRVTEANNLGVMSEQQFAETVARAREAKAEDERRIVAAREFQRQQEQADREERARLRAENDRLAAEAEAARNERAAAEAAARLEREAAESVLRAQAAEERKAREEAEREARLLREAEAEERARVAAEALRVHEEAVAAEQARLKAEHAAAAAPDKQKLLAFARQVRELDIADMATAAGEAVAVELRGMIERFAVTVERRADAL